MEKLLNVRLLTKYEHHIEGNVIIMARKYDRYGRNRQFRRNPTRSRNFFPYQLPFKNDFRLITPDAMEVSASTSARWRQVVRDVTNPNKRKFDNFDEDGYYLRMQYTQTPPKRNNPARTAIGLAGASVVGDVLVHTEGLISGGLALATGFVRNPVVRRYAIASVL